MGTYVCHFAGGGGGGGTAVLKKKSERAGLCDFKPTFGYGNSRKLDGIYVSKKKLG